MSWTTFLQTLSITSSLRYVLVLGQAFVSRIEDGTLENLQMKSENKSKVIHRLKEAGKSITRFWPMS